VAGAADALDLLQSEAGVVGHHAGGGGEGLAEQAVQTADLAHLDRGRPRQAAEQLAEVAAVGLVQTVHLNEAKIETGALHLGQRRVHAIRAGARGEADYPAI
jgi:hypothetical protein